MSNRTVRLAQQLAMPRLRLAKPQADAPLFIIGAGRSGNTLVRRILLASGQIYIPPETFVLGEIFENWPLMRALRWRQRVWLFCSYFERHQHFNYFGIPNLDEFLQEALRLEDRRLQPLVSLFFAYLGRLAGSEAKRWGDKTPWNTYHLPAIAQTFPSAKFLWLIRDGRDVALSYREAKLQTDFETAAGRWVDANVACARLARWSPFVKRLRYEDLTADPEKEMAAVFDWAGLDFDSAMLTRPVGPMGDVELHAHHTGVMAPITAKSVGRWMQTVTPDELARTPQAFHEMLARLDY